MKEPAATHDQLAAAEEEPVAPPEASTPSLPPAPGQLALCLLREPGYVVELFNSAAAGVWGRPASQVLGHPFLETLPQPDVARYAAACRAVWQSGQAVVWPELPVILATDTTSPLEISYFTLSFQPFCTKHEQLAGILLVAQEVTSLLQARQQVHESQVELAATIAGLADYVAELTHVAGQ